jgi:hypothetical protein
MSSVLVRRIVTDKISSTVIKRLGHHLNITAPKPQKWPNKHESILAPSHGPNGSKAVL